MQLHLKKLSALYACALLVSCGGGADEAVGKDKPKQPSTVVKTYKVSTLLSTGGQVSASQATVEQNETAQFIITPNDNYIIDDVRGCDGSLSANSYTTSPVSQDCTVSVNFLYVNQAPNNVRLAGATALSHSSISVEWLSSIDNEDQNGEISYDIYVSTQPNLQPNEQAHKLRVSEQQSARINELLADTVYYVLVSAQDTQGNISYSNVLSVSTMSAAPVINASQIFHSVNDFEVAAKSLSYTLKAQETAPKIGDIIMSADHNGILRKVTDVTIDNTRVVLSTEPAALNEIYNDVDINTTIKLLDIPTNKRKLRAKKGTQSAILNNSNRDVSRLQQSLTWNESQLHLSQSAQHKSPKKVSVNSASNNGSDAHSSQKVNDKHLILQGPSRVAFMPGAVNSFDINAGVVNDPNDALEVSELILVKVVHNRIEATLENYGVSTSKIVPAGGASSEILRLTWQPTQAQVDLSTSQPYIATFKATVVEKNCSLSCLESSAFLRVKIQLGETELPTLSSFEFDTKQDMHIRGKAEYLFEPTISVAAKIEDAALTAAHAKVEGLLDFQLNLKLIADASAKVSGSSEFARKSFSKVLMVGNAPVVIHGEFILNGHYEAQAFGQLSQEQSLNVSYYFDAGFEYKAGSWEPVFSGKPTLIFTLKDGAKSRALTQFSLIPELKLRFYEYEAGHIKFEPSVYTDVGIEGEYTGVQNLHDTESAGNANKVKSASNAPYRFTHLQADVSSMLKVNASFDAFDKSFEAWPVPQTNDLFELEVLSKTAVMGLPTVRVQDTSDTESANSCFVSATAYITSFDSAIGRQVFINNWEYEANEWSLESSALLADPLGGSSVLNDTLTSKAQVLVNSFSQYTLRFAGFSNAGAWASQYQDLHFDFSDKNQDQLPDYWATKYALTNASDDTDGDGLNNSDEFTHCTQPQKSDSDNDGMPDGWEVNYALNPIVNDASNDSDLDGRSNLQEFLDDSHPQLEDINQPPLVFAGNNQSVDELSTVNLQASASDGGAIQSVLWTQISGSFIGLDANTTLQSTFTAPAVDGVSVLSFEFSATDNSGATSTSQVHISINPVNAKPTAVAGTDLQLRSGESATLDASGSFDTDGAIVSYQWTVLNAQTLFIEDENVATTHFIAPEVVSLSVFEVSLSVVDDEGATSTSIINITVSPNPSLPALSSIALEQLNNSVVLIRDVSETGLHSVLALLLTQSGGSVYMIAESRIASSDEVVNKVTESPLVWRVENTSLILESATLGRRSLVFNDGKIDINDQLSALIPELSELARVSELYKYKSLITDDLIGHRFTVLKNNKNTYIDFVSAERAFVYTPERPITYPQDESYTRDSLDFYVPAGEQIQSVSWSYHNGESSNEFMLALDPSKPIVAIIDSFNTFKLIENLKIINISLLPPIRNPLSELVFTNNNLAACIKTMAQVNLWVSVDEVTRVDCPNMEIDSAQGIEKLSQLEYLNLSGNLLTSIDTSQHEKLQALHVTNNQLRSVDFSNNALLNVAQLTNNAFSNASTAYLASISWISDLTFDSTIVLPSGNDFVFLISVDALTNFHLFTSDTYDYDFSVDWGDGTVTSNNTQDAMHSYAQAGSYEVTISGTYPALKFCESNDGCAGFKIDVLKWGRNQWLSMEGTFSGLAKINILATDTPDLSQTSSLSFMFYKTPNFNSDISSWNISAVTDMNFMFGFADSFNGDISRWDTANVTNMGGLFYFSASFNGDISRWDTSAVTKMHSLFAFATAFNGDLSQWNTSAVTYMATMFLGASNFNGSVKQWDVQMVTNMEKMFYNATSMSGNLRNWTVNKDVRHKNFIHKDSLLIEPIWLN